jgi:glycosyltransferase involved in cell wall biosynthesis
VSRLRLFCVISSSEIGGAEGCFLTLLKGLPDRDVEVSVAYHGSGPMVADYRAHAARAWSLDLANIFDRRTRTRLSTLMRETNAQVVHTHLWNGDVLGGLAARRAGIPAVATVYGAYHLPIGVTGLRGLRRHVLSQTFRAIYRSFDRVIAISQYVRDDLSGRAGLAARRSTIDVIYPGVDRVQIVSQAVAAADRRDTRPGDDQPRIINVANFFPIKGQEWLLRALPLVLARFPRARCVFTSDGPDRRPMEALAANLGVRGQVDFEGGTTTSRLFDLMSDSDVFVFPSLSEGFGLAILEAWASGIPVVASRVGAIPEIIEHERTGLLVPPRDPGALANAIIAVLSDRALAQRLADAGREALRTRFSSDDMVEQTMNVYGRLC